MTGITRIIPFLRPHRFQLGLSFLFALFVAIFWGANLSVVFPIVKVLLQGQNLHEYVSEQVELAEAKSHRLMSKLEKIDPSYHSGIDNLPEVEEDEDEGVAILNRRVKLQSQLTEATHAVLRLRHLQTFVLPYVPSDRFDTLAAILGVFLLATVLKGIFIYLQDTLIGSVVQLTTMDIRKRLFRHTLKLDYQTLSKAGTADLLSRFTFDIETLAAGLGLLGGKVMREPLKALACIVLAFWVNWQLTLLSLVFVPVALLLFNRIGQILKGASHRSMESMSRIYKVLEEAFDAAKVVISFNGGQRHRSRFHQENKVYYEKSMNIVRIDSLTSPVTEVFGMFAVLVALLPGAYLVLRNTNSIWGINLSDGPIDVAELAVLYALLAGISDPVRKLSSVYARLKRATAAADRIFLLMDEETLVKQSETPVELPRHSDSVEFSHVSFVYAAHEEYLRPRVLDDVSLRIPAGDVVAVVGENGSGKSTLVNLLPRFYDPSKGSVLIDGVDVRHVRLQDLRSQLGVVTQETLLFDESILENIRYGKPDASREEVEHVAAQAHVLQFLEQLPQGFETRVGEKGVRLSGGQRQRIALARAMLRDPSILILDEATSAIDAQSEYLIHQALSKFVDGRTVFIITHSMTQSILDLVTKVVVMDQGQVRAVGTHDELLRTCAIYQRLHHVQVQQRATPGEVAQAGTGQPQKKTRPDAA